MNDIALLAYLIVLGFLAVQDFKYRKVSNLGLCALWLIALFCTPYSFMMALVFVTVWLIAEVGTIYKLKILGWADVLFLPSFVAFALILQLPLIVYMIGMILGWLLCLPLKFHKTNNYPLLLLGFVWMLIWAGYYFISTVL